MYDVMCLAAGLILAKWHLAGMRSATLRDGMLEPSVDTPGPGSWEVTSADAARALVATVLAGARYEGWQRACAIADRELSQEAA